MKDHVLSFPFIRYLMKSNKNGKYIYIYFLNRKEKMRNAESQGTVQVTTTQFLTSRNDCSTNVTSQSKKKQKWGRRFPQLIRGKKIETIVQEKRCSFTWMYLRGECIATLFFLQEISSNFLFIVSIKKLTNEHPSPIRKVCAFVKTFFVNRFRLK